MDINEIINKTLETTEMPWKRRSSSPISKCKANGKTKISTIE